MNSLVLEDVNNPIMEQLKLRIYGFRVTKKQFLVTEGIMLLIFAGLIIFFLATIQPGNKTNEK